MYRVIGLIIQAAAMLKLRIVRNLVSVSGFSYDGLDCPSYNGRLAKWHRV
jgi:hypothetical protein